MYIDLRRLFEVSGSGSPVFRPEGTCPLSAASWNVGSKFTLEHARIPPLSADDISARHRRRFWNKIRTSAHTSLQNRKPAPRAGRLGPLLAFSAGLHARSLVT